MGMTTSTVKVPRRRAAVLATLYNFSAISVAAAILAITTGHYLSWAVALPSGVISLLGAYWIRTGRRPWHKHVD